MYNKRLLVLSVLILGITGVALITGISLGRGMKNQIPDTPDSKVIQETIKSSYEIESYAAQTFDVSLFPTVFANDKRGGKIEGTVLDLVRSVRNDYSLTEDSVGYLDYKLAYYAWREKGALQIEQVWAKATSEGRDYLTEEESKSLIDSSGRVAMPRVPTSVRYTINITFISIIIEGDLAKAVFDDGPTTSEMTLVKKDGNWYIIGLRTIASHP